MVAKIENGDYMLRNHALNSANYYDALAQSARMLMIIPRGRYYPDKNFGSYLYSVSDLSFEDKLLTFARQALLEFDGVFVKSVSVSGSKITYVIVFDFGERTVSIDSENDLQRYYTQNEISVL